MPRLLLLCVFLVLGCSRTPRAVYPLEEKHDVAPLAYGSEFDLRNTGAIEGTIRWGGTSTYFSFELPAVARVGNDVNGWKNPLIPKIAANHGVADVVVYLREVAPEYCRPWPASTVEVRMADRQIHVQNAASQQRRAVGFVRRGDTISFRNDEPRRELLRARGSDFFTWTLSPGEAIRERSMLRSGLVELSSASGQFWARAWLFVIDHPYYTLSHDDGRYRLSEIPMGEYELVYWMPNWNMKRFERDPELIRPVRLTYHAPLERTMRVRVSPGKTLRLDLQITPEMFEPNGSTASSK